MNTALPRIICERQNNPWSCTLAAWEYLTGVPRLEIAESLGHDGGTIVDTTKPSPLNRSGILPNEIASWAREAQDLQILQMTSIEYYDHFDALGHNSDGNPTAEQIVSRISGQLAALTVKMPGSDCTGHEVAWMGDFYIDPANGLPRQLGKTDLLAATVILEGRSLDDRVQALIAETNAKRAFASVAADWWIEHGNLETAHREPVAARLWSMIADQVLFLKEAVLTTQETDGLLARTCEAEGIENWTDRFPAECIMKVTTSSVDILETGNGWQNLWCASGK